MADLLEEVAEGHGERVALQFIDKSFTYADVGDRVSRLRRGLHRRGVGKGDRVLVALDNGVEAVAAYFAVLGIGATVTLVSAELDDVQIADRIRRIGPRYVIVDAVGDSVRRYVEGHTDVGIASVHKAKRLKHAVSLDSLARRRHAPVTGVDPSDIAQIAFTSVTRGEPRAVQLTHSNLVANIDQVTKTAGTAFEGDDIVLCAVSLAHLVGSNFVVGNAMSAAATIALCDSPFDPAQAIALADVSAPAVMVATPWMYDALLEGAVECESLSSVRLFICVAGRLNYRTTRRWRHRFGQPIWETYGLVEASPIVACATAAGRVRPGSTGRAIQGVHVRVVDGSGRDVDVGDIGEIVVRGENVFGGYLDDPATTEQVLRGGCLHTGDVGLIDDDSLLHVLGRLDNRVDVGGFSVYPGEVEEVLLAHPDIGDAAVTTYFDESRRRLIAFVAASSDDAPIDASLVAEHLAAYLPTYKRPEDVYIVDRIPRNSRGAVLFADLAADDAKLG